MLDQLFQSMMSSEGYDPSSNPAMVEGENIINYGDMTTETTTVAPASTLPSYQGSYEFPMESWVPVVQGKSPGLTEEVPTKPLNLDKINRDFLFSLDNQIQNEDVNFVHNAFSLLDRKPVINNKEIDISLIPSYIKHQEFRQELIEQALELESDPSLNSADKLALMQSHQTSITLMGELEHGKKIMNDEISATAKWAKNNPLYKSHANYFEKIVDDKGNFVSQGDYMSLLKKEHNDMITAWKQQNPFPTNGPMSWQPVDFNPTAGKVVYNPETKRYETMDTRPKYMDSQEGWYGTLDRLSASYWEGVKRGGLYDDVKLSLMDAYNHPQSPTTKLRTNYYSKYGPNKGGDVQGELGTIEFDLGTNFGVVPEYGPNAGETIIRPEAVELTNLVQLAYASTTADNGVKVVVGSKTGSSPESLTITDDAKKILQNLWEDIGSATTRKKDALSRLPKGSITFSSIVAGGEPYYAYNIKFNSDYIKTDRYIGTADNPGPAHVTKKSPLFTDGFTIYLPKQTATGVMGDGNGGEIPVSRLARDNKNASTVSAVEGLFSVKNDVQLTVPGGARMNLTRNPETKETRISGWNVILNPNTGKMDTIHMPLQVVPIDKATDLDWIVDDFYISSLYQLDINDSIIKKLSKDKKVFDPKILQHQNQY